VERNRVGRSRDDITRPAKNAKWRSSETDDLQLQGKMVAGPATSGTCGYGQRRRRVLT